MKQGICHRENNLTQKSEISLRPTVGIQPGEKITYPEVGFSWPLNNNVY